MPPNRLIVRPILQILSLRSRNPTHIIRPFLRRKILPTRPKSLQQIDKEPLIIAADIRGNSARLHRARHDLRIQLGNLLRVQGVGQFTLHVAPERAEEHVLRRFDGVVGDAGSTLEGTGRCGDEADVAAFACCFGHEWEQVLEEEGMTHVVGAKLHFVAIYGHSCREGHNSGIGEQDVESVEVCQKSFGSDFDGLQ